LCSSSWSLLTKYQGQHGVSSLAVVNSDKIIGNISMTDVKHVMKSYRHGLLWKTCFQFVSYIKLEQGIIEGQDRLPVFDVRPDTHLGFAIAKLLATRAHRVWVTDEKQQLLGVVSLTDIFRILATVAGIKLPNENRRTSLNVSTFNRRDIK
jgi:CBS domain-containing protein